MIEKATEILKDENLEISHPLYTEYERKQYTATLKAGHTVEIIIKDDKGTTVSTKKYTAKYINCHFNIQWQDKGEKDISSINE